MVLLLCYMPFAMLITLISYDTYILSNALIHLKLKALTLLQPTPVKNETDDDNKRTLFRQYSDKVNYVTKAWFQSQYVSLMTSRSDKSKVSKMYIKHLNVT